MPRRTRPRRKLLIRPLETHDITTVCEMCHNTLPEPLRWTPRELSAYCKKHRPFGLGAFSQDELVGFVIGLDDAEPVLELTRFAVHPLYQRKRVATRLFHHLLDLYDQAHTVITCVPERAVNAQLLLKALGFRCSRVNREAFHGPDPVGYHFRYERILP